MKLFKEKGVPTHLFRLPGIYGPGRSGLDAIRGGRTQRIIKKDQLRPGKVHFTITPEGKIGTVQMRETSGYPAIDAHLVELINNMPGEWIPATNAQGKKVEQEWVFFFGFEGC